MAKFNPADIQELRKDFQPSAQVLTALPSANKCIDKQIVEVDTSTGRDIYWYSKGIFTLLISTSGNTVTSVFSRKGAVVAQAGDYTAEQITQDENNRFVTDTQISNWNSATVLRSQSGSVSVTASNPKTVVFTVPFASTPIVSVTFSGVDDSAVTINPAHITRSTTQFTVPAADFGQDGTIYWTAGV